MLYLQNSLQGVQIQIIPGVQIQIIPMLGQIEMLKRGDRIRIAGVSAQGVCQQDGVIKVKVSVKVISKFIKLCWSE
jgi:hypothetical protein